MPASADNALSHELAGEPVLLLGDRAMYWPARKRLIIADLHLGKSHVFRQAGIAVPSGATQHDLQRLSRLVGATGARELWIVGDLLHGPAAQAAWRETWLQWRDLHETLDVAALTGNHDRALAQAPLRVRQLGHECEDGPFLFRHIPGEDPEGRHIIAGHVHPQARVPGVPRNWPVFWLREGLTVLPAFSGFTGGVVVAGGPGETMVACVDGTAVALVTRLAPGLPRAGGARRRG